MWISFSWILELNIPGHGYRLSQTDSNIKDMMKHPDFTMKKTLTGLTSFLVLALCLSVSCVCASGPCVSGKENSCFAVHRIKSVCAPYLKTTTSAPYLRTKGEAPYQKSCGQAPCLIQKGEAPYLKTCGSAPSVKVSGEAPYILSCGYAPVILAECSPPQQASCGVSGGYYCKDKSPR